MFIMPAKGKITSPFGMRTHPIYKDRRMHWGVDIGNHADNTIVAAGSGKVRLVVTNNPKKGYGHYVIITHSSGYETLYAHLKSVAVKAGQTVGRGQYIGVKGTTGASTGVHLHFEVHTGRWNNKWSNAKNPLNYVVDPAVKQVQELLVSAGYKLVVDGIDGPQTDKAVRAFQKVNKLVVDGIPGKATMSELEKSKPVATSNKTLYLPKTAASWRIYPTNKAPIKANALSTKLNPKKFGGLSYKVLANPQKDVYTIQTAQLGKVNIYAGSETGATIK